MVRISVKNPLADGIYVERETIVRASGGAREEIARIGGIGSLRGLHNAQNAACASACALALGVGKETLQNGLRSFPGLAHRMEQVGRRGNVLFVNDSKGTNADAAAHALSSFADIFWIAGGRAKAGGITGLTEYFPRIRKAYLIGEAASEFGGTLGERVPHEMSGTLEVAVASAARDAEASGLVDPVVLLSPACASFDQYRNFEIRGGRFRDLVNALPGIEAGGMIVASRRGWFQLASRAILEDMETLSTRELPKAFFAELEKRLFWWEPVGSQPRSEARILAQAMSSASFEEVRRLEQILGPDLLAQTMLGAEPGWIDERSWEFWRGRLMLATGRKIPEAPPRRSFDAGSV